VDRLPVPAAGLNVTWCRSLSLQGTRYHAHWLLNELAPMFRSLHLLSRLLPVLALFTLVACTPTAPPAEQQAHAAAITISDAWVNQPPPGAAVAGAYLRLHNPGPGADRLLTVDTDAAQRVEIHDMNMVSGMMQMRAVEGGLPLPAGETTELAPGGLHLMLMAPNMELAAGDEVTMALSFEHAPAQTVIFQVRSLMDADDAHAPMHEGHHGHH